MWMQNKREMNLKWAINTRGTSSRTFKKYIYIRCIKNEHFLCRPIWRNRRSGKETINFRAVPNDFAGVENQWAMCFDLLLILCSCVCLYTWCDASPSQIPKNILHGHFSHARITVHVYVIVIMSTYFWNHQNIQNDWLHRHQIIIHDCILPK